MGVKSTLRRPPITAPTAPTTGTNYADLLAACNAVVVNNVRPRDAMGMRAPAIPSASVTGSWQINAVTPIPIELVTVAGDLVVPANGLLLLGNETPDTQVLVVIIEGDLLIETGATVSLTTRKRGLVIQVRGKTYISGTIDTSGMTPWASPVVVTTGAGVPGQALKLSTNRSVPAAGAAGGGGHSSPTVGVNGTAGVNGETGGGASGGTFNGGSTTGGGAGTSWSGGPGSYGTNAGAAGSGGVGADAGAGAGVYNGADNEGAGAGNPSGVHEPTNLLSEMGQWSSGRTRTGLGTSPGQGAGGLIVLYCRGKAEITATGVVKSNGAQGGPQTVGGGGSGGGSVNIIYEATMTNNGTVQANGTANIAGASAGGTGGAGTARVVTP